MTTSQLKKNIAEFVAKWKGKGYEKGETQVFWLSLLRDIFGVERPEELISFEDKVMLDHTSFMDARIPSSKVLIEQKSLDKSLDAKIKQSDGSFLTPFQQAKRYISEMKLSDHPRWVITCNFAEFHVYDMEKPQGDPEVIKLEELPAQWHRLGFLVNVNDEIIQKQTEVSFQAGKLVGQLYDLLRASYHNPDSEQTLRELNKLCVRLVFCLYAEDVDLFNKRNAFYQYLAPYRNRPADLRRALIALFEVLDTPVEQRDPYLAPELAEFPYVNGGLFAGKVEIPFLTEEFINELLDKASLGFDWSPISPTIFGALFESTLNPETRHDAGMHYTSIENIHRVIDPLFLDDLRNQLNEILKIKDERRKRQRLKEYRVGLGKLRFFDPACGSGNFLTETYMSLRRLENEALRVEKPLQREFHFGEGQWSIEVSLKQFYGIEINDFAVAVAKTALWIAEDQMMRETADIIGAAIDLFPLKNYNNIIEGNALIMDWHDVVDPCELNYIIGNPPFLGARIMSAGQKKELTDVLGKNWKNSGNLDYVAGWYAKCMRFMNGTDIKAALVSTNSISQGEQVAALWQPLIDAGFHIDFAWRSFRWDSESSEKAHVHCVIIGFSRSSNSDDKKIFDDESVSVVKNISPYLIEGPNILIESRSKPICDVPEIGIGNKPIDGGFYLFTEQEMNEFIASEPSSKPYFRPWYGAQEFINRTPRYCLWLGDCSPEQLHKMPKCRERINSVRKLRLQSKSAGTRKLADTPTRFHVENFPDSDYLLIPRVSSERRQYIPIGFMPKNTIASDAVQIIPGATLYHFGVLTSSVHMAWMRLVAGRLKSDYRYSKDIVYNNFPWPEVTEKQRAEIERTAQAILDARNRYRDSSMAALYDDVTMPIELRRAHRENDRAVAAAYNFAPDLTEAEICSRLLKRYSTLVKS